MHRSTSKQRQLIRRTIVYALMVLSVASLVTILVLLMLGFRFNRDNNSLQQGGLVQFLSRPSGANITIGSAKLANRTPNKITVNPGQYLTTMTREGYRPWSKTVDVQAGRVLWLNYAQLIPSELVTKSILPLGQASGLLQATNGKSLAYFEKQSPSVLKVVDISGDTPKSNTIQLPETLVPARATASPTLRYSSKDSDNWLASVKVGNETQWLYIDPKSPTNSQNLSSTYDLAIKTAQFDPRSNTQVIVHTTDGDVRTIDVAKSSLSAVLAKKVLTFSLYDDNHLLYIYAKNGAERTLAYLTLGEKVGRDLPMIGTDAVQISGDEYFSNAYVSVVGKNKMVRIYRLASLPSSNSDSALSSNLLFSTSLSEAPLYATVSGSGRFFVTQTKGGFTTYDIELDRYTITKFGPSQLSELRWLDNYHVYYPGKKSLNITEFDGSNPYQIERASGSVAVLTSNGKYMYTISQGATGYNLQRTNMTVN